MSGDREDRYPYGVPPMPPPSAAEAAGHHVPCPGTVTAATVLWIITGVLLTLSYSFSVFMSYGNGGSLATAVFAGLWAVGAAVIWRLGSGLRHGRDKRTALTVLGVVAGLGLFPLVIAAIVLQYVRASREWFALTPAETP